MQRLGTITLYLSIWIFLLSGPLSAGVPSDAQKDSIAPKAAFPKPNHHFGEVFEGEDITHDFVVENKGDAPLVIKNIRPD